MGHGAMTYLTVTWVPFLTWPHLDGIMAAQVSSPHQERGWKYPHVIHVSFFCICDSTFYIWLLVHVKVLPGLVFLVFSMFLGGSTASVTHWLLGLVHTGLACYWRFQLGGARKSIWWLSCKHRVVLARNVEMDNNRKTSKVKIIWLIIAHHHLNNQRCCTVATNVNFHRKLTGLRVANINQKIFVIGGVDSSKNDRTEVLCGILQLVLMVCWFVGASVQWDNEDLGRGREAGKGSKRPRHRCSSRATCLFFAW